MYFSPGRSAAVLAAAYARSLLEPTTKLSKVYLGLRLSEGLEFLPLKSSSTLDDPEGRVDLARSFLSAPGVISRLILVVLFTV